MRDRGRAGGGGDQRYNRDRPDAFVEDDVLPSCKKGSKRREGDRGKNQRRFASKRRKEQRFQRRSEEKITGREKKGVFISCLSIQSSPDHMHIGW